MHNQAKVRQYIRIPVPSPSIWQRARAVVSSAVAQVRVIASRVASAVVKKVSGIRASIARVARAAMVRRPWILTRDGAKHVVEMVHAGNRAVAVRVVAWFRFQRKHAPRKISSWTRSTWRRVLRPFMRVRVVVLGIGAVVVGLVVSPVITLVILAGSGAMLVGLSRLIALLEMSDRPASRVVLVAIEWIVQAGLIAVHIAAAAVVVALCLVSMAFAVTEVFELVLRYFDVASAASVAALAFFALTANWGLAFVEIAWLAFIHTDKRRARTPSQERQAIPLIRIDAERAWVGNPETANVSEGSLVVFASVEKAMERSHTRTGKCMGCDLDDGGARFGIGNLSMLCSTCFSYLVEDELVSAAEDGKVSAEDVMSAIGGGIEVPASVIIASGARLKSTRIDLDVEDITCRSAASSQSERDPSKIYWAETAWWFDGRGNRRARRWHGFVAGNVTAKVDYAHDREVRGFYVVEPCRFTSLARGMGPYRTLRHAQEIAADEISDARKGDAFSPPAVLEGSLRSVS